ncbi:hypothetical protein [Emcibacter sp.]|uniref:hypothetical protein n=1 Tax=Emcibacter sp. TaxID=1979954 RepID=UPI002AA7A8AF|nr:hypothetical protein [Emcibacter sp.]
MSSDLFGQIESLADQLEKFSKYTLSRILASHTVISCIGRDNQDETTESLIGSCRKTEVAARMHYRSKRIQRLLDKVDNPKRRRKRKKSMGRSANVL